MFVMNVLKYASSLIRIVTSDRSVPVCPLVGRLVSHNFRKGREVTLQCFYRSKYFKLQTWNKRYVNSVVNKARLIAIQLGCFHPLLSSILILLCIETYKCIYFLSSVVIVRQGPKSNAPHSLFLRMAFQISAGYLGRRMNIQPQENNGAGNQRHELHEGNKTHNFNSSPGPIMGFALRESSWTQPLHMLVTYSKKWALSLNGLPFYPSNPSMLVNKLNVHD